ncbi:maltase A1-like [Episyrphus balteatus]|uniref:maltase A1-like n=1 Tax=Episyrphus balteatus TaxID=286459 RepID=UPI002485AAFA|nr:maltase A1-like [Episyrphus balteatus]
MKLNVALVLVISTILIAEAKDWWMNGNFYQIYPRSFRDSDGDGIGDLNGVTEKLQYLKDVGFTAAWLSPIFKSPMADFGYDISDFYQIHPEYGTIQDFENLIKKAKEVGLKIILDFVPNHTSDENEWFKKSIDGDPKYKDYYIWHNGVVDPVTGERKPPSNWLSAFRYSAWEWNEVRQQYYLHQFAIKQPDLNYRNPAVVEEMKNVMRFWLAKGISGFRIDACPFLFEVDLDRNGLYADEPAVTSGCPDPDDYCHLQHIYTNDLPETMDMIYQWRELTDSFKKENGSDTKILLTEAYTNFGTMMKYYGDGTRKGSYVPFNFDFMGNVNKDSKATDVVTNVNKWLNAMPKGKDFYPNWVLGNHDSKRVASRFGVERADLINIMLQTLPGNAVTYNGEELAMTDVFIKWEDTVDPQACNANPNNFNTYSRDPARTPFQWDASPNAGFTEGSETWLPVSEDYKTKNVLMQERAPNSHLQIFKKLIRLRQEPSMQDLYNLQIKAIADDIVIYSRYTEGSNRYVIILNLGSTTQTININDHFPVGQKVEIITSSITSDYSDGEVIDATRFSAKGQVGTVVVAV